MRKRLRAGVDGDIRFLFDAFAPPGARVTLGAWWLKPELAVGIRHMRGEVMLRHAVVHGFAEAPE